MCVHVWVYDHHCKAYRTKRGLDAWKLEVQVGMCCLAWVLGTELISSGMTSVFNHGDISQLRSELFFFIICD